MNRRQIALFLIGALCLASAASAWSAEGHRRITDRALRSFGDAAPLWSLSERERIVAASTQPDLMRPRELPALRAGEAPRHYLNLEILSGRPLPPDRWGYYRLLIGLAAADETPAAFRGDRDLRQVGTLPYALVEETQRLAAIFAQLRAGGDDPGLRQLAAIQAGYVAHYAQDLCQPLHTTVHHDGRAREDGSSPGTGIHHRVDGLIHRLPLQDHEGVQSPPRALQPLFGELVAALEESHARVDEVYGLEQAISDFDSEGVVDPRLVDFVMHRFVRAVALTADLLQTAWTLSNAVEVPEWARLGRADGDSPN